MTIATVSPALLKTWLHDGDELALLDVREHGQYGEGHLFYATSVPFSRLEMEIGRLVPRHEVRLVLVDEHGRAGDGVAQRAAARLADLGYRQIRVLDGGIAAWKAAGLTVFAGVNLPSKAFGELAESAYHTPRITAPALAAMLKSGQPVVVLDGRPVSEFRKMNIPTAICCPNGELAYRIGALVPDDQTPIVINCAGRTRSIIGAQTLINLGLPNPVYALENGTQGWFLADLPLEHGGVRHYGAASGSTQWQAHAQRLAARFDVPSLSAATVKTWAQDPGRTLFLCDVRTPEEFARGSLPGARHTPGGQLIQAFDQFVGVRGARLVLFDDDGVRAPTVASWLRQQGHDAGVLDGGLHSGLALSVPSPARPQPLATISAAELSAPPSAHDRVIIDLRPSMAFRAGHVRGARWSIRPRLPSDLARWPGDIVLVADEPQIAAWAMVECKTARPARVLAGGLTAWTDAGLPVEASPHTPPDADCIDFLFFVHDRHDGNRQAALRYLAWETGLVDQLDDQELAGFRLPRGHHPD